MSRDLDKMTIHSKCVRDGVFEVNGVIFYAETTLDAIRKYLRVKKT